MDKQVKSNQNKPQQVSESVPEVTDEEQSSSKLPVISWILGASGEKEKGQEDSLKTP